MKIKKPSLKGMKHTEYLGHFAQDKYMEKGHNLSIGNALKKVGSVVAAPISGMVGAAKSLAKGDIRGAIKQNIESGPAGPVISAVRAATGRPMAPSVPKKSLSGPKRALIRRPMGK